MTAVATAPEAPPAEQPLWDENGLTLAGLNALREPTPAGEIKQRAAPGGSGKMLDYVDARFVMDRLDMFAGPQNWQDSYEDVPNVSPPAMRCSLSIRVMGAWITKTDVGDASTIEPTKGASSDAFKRAAVKWGVARDLYDAREDHAAPVQRGGQAQQPFRQPAPAQAPQQAAPAGSTSGAPLDPAVINPTGWVCPIHGTVKYRPGGVSNKTGTPKPYPPFAACGSDGPPYCNEKPPRNPAPVAAAPTAPVWSDEGPEYDDLPF